MFHRDSWSKGLWLVIASTPTLSSGASAALLPLPTPGTSAVRLRAACSLEPRWVPGAAQGRGWDVTRHAAFPCASRGDNLICPWSFGHTCLRFWALATVLPGTEAEPVAGGWWGGLQASPCVLITAPCSAAGGSWQRQSEGLCPGPSCLLSDQLLSITMLRFKFHELIWFYSEMSLSWKMPVPLRQTFFGENFGFFHGGYFQKNWSEAISPKHSYSAFLRWNLIFHFKATFLFCIKNFSDVLSPRKA